MSWDSYIGNLIAQTADNGDRACIVGIDGSKWTTDDADKALKITPAEAAEVAAIFKSRDFRKFQTNGIHVEGQKYQFLRHDEDSKTVMGKLKNCGAITIQASRTALVMCHVIEGQQQGMVNKGVSNIAEYLEGNGM